MKRKTGPDESVENLAHRLELVLDKPERRSVAFISANAGEGTSMIARDYAAALSDFADRPVLLIDAGRVDTKYFNARNIDAGNSLAEAVAAGRPVKSALHELSPHLSLARWTSPRRGRGNAGKLLADAAFWDSLYEQFGTLVIDAPSLKQSPDGIALASRADATVIVVEAEQTRQPVIEHLRDRLIAAGANVAGTVLNKRRFYIPARVYRRM